MSSEVKTIYYDNGQKSSEGSYDGELGLEYGKWIKWHDNGQKKSEGNYHLHRKIDKWIEFYENGHKKSEGNYKIDVKIGSWSYWNDDGDVEIVIHKDYDHHDDKGFNSNDSNWGSYSSDTNFDIDENGNIKR